MRDRDDPRYDELLRGLQEGRPPAWVPEAQRERFDQLADAHRLGISATLHARFPLASFYASALFGGGEVDGVAAALVALPPSDEPLDAKVRLAALAWSHTLVDRPDLVDLFAYDDGMTGPRESDQTFDHDVLGFAAVVERLARRHAPADIVRKYVPARARQRLAFVGDAPSRTAREIPLALA